MRSNEHKFDSCVSRASSLSHRLWFDNRMEAATLHLLPLFLTLCCAVRSLEAASGCNVEWVDYGGQKDLACGHDSRRTWWVRDTVSLDGWLTDCTALTADEWTRSNGCSGIRTYCDAHVNQDTTSFEYCCTSGPNPAEVPANQRDCYSIAGEYVSA